MKSGTNLFEWTLEVGNWMKKKSISFHEFINIKFFPTNFLAMNRLFG